MIDAVHANHLTDASAAKAITPHYIETLFSLNGPKHLFDDLYHFSGRHYQRHANNRNMLPVVKFMTSILLYRMMMQPNDIAFIPEAITNGKIYYDLAEGYEDRIRSVRDGHLTTYRMAEVLNKDELDIRTEKNKIRAMQRVELFHRLLPNHAVISPTGMEAMLKTLIHEPGFTNKQMLRDEDFEAFWIAICLHCNRGVFADDVIYSRNGNFETFALFLTQYGIGPSLRPASVDVIGAHKKQLTPFDYASMLFSHLLDVVPRGFTSDLSLKMLMRMIMLEDMRQHKLAHPQWGRLDPQAFSPSISGLSASHDKKFDALKRDVFTFIASYNLLPHLGNLFGLDGYDGLYDFARERVNEAPSLIGFRPDKDYRSRNDSILNSDAALQRGQLFRHFSSQIPYQLDGDFFSSKPSLLPQYDFKKDLTLPEQVALKAIAGLDETLKPARSGKRSTLLLVDRRGGECAEAYATKYQAQTISESRGIVSSFDTTNFEENVTTHNISKARSLVQKLSNARNVVLSSEDCEFAASIFSQYRSAISALGPPRMSGAGKLLLAQEYLRRRVDHVIFDRHWVNSDFLCALRIYARKIQLGLIDRPLNRPAFALHVQDLVAAEEGEVKYSSLADDLYSIHAYIATLQQRGTQEFPPQLMRCALEIVVMLDMYYARDVNRAAHEDGKEGLVQWQSVPLSLTAGLESQKTSILELKSQVKDFLLSYGVQFLEHNDLKGQLEKIDSSYLRAKSALEAREDVMRARDPQNISQQKIPGAAVS